MSKLYQGSINLSNIDKQKLYTCKNGDKWLNVSIWINDEPDKFGNHLSIQQSTKKDESKIYLGNCKEYQKDRPTPSATPSRNQVADDDLSY